MMGTCIGARLHKDTFPHPCAKHPPQPRFTEVEEDDSAIHPHQPRFTDVEEDACAQPPHFGIISLLGEDGSSCSFFNLPEIKANRAYRLYCESILYDIVLMYTF